MRALHGHRLLGAGAGDDIWGLPLPLQSLLDGGGVRRQIGQLVEHVALADDGVHQVAVPWGWKAGVCMCSNGKSPGPDLLLVCFLTIELVLDDVVERLEEEEDQVMVLRRGEQEPAGGEGLQ